MEVKYEKTFLKSLKMLFIRYTRVYIIWDFFRYGIRRFFKNVWRFRKELYEYYPFDWRYTMSMFRRGLEVQSEYCEKHGLEIPESRLKKVEKMNRAIQIIKWFENDDFLELAEKDLGYEYVFRGFEFEKCEDSEYFKMINNLTEKEEEKNRILSERSREIEIELFQEFLDILKGQDMTTFNKDEEWEKQFDGSGIFSWWD